MPQSGRCRDPVVRGCRRLLRNRYREAPGRVAAPTPPLSERSHTVWLLPRPQSGPTATQGPARRRCPIAAARPSPQQHQPGQPTGRGDLSGQDDACSHPRPRAPSQHRRWRSTTLASRTNTARRAPVEGWSPLRVRGRRREQCQHPGCCAAATRAEAPPARDGDCCPHPPRVQEDASEPRGRDGRGVGQG